jgi:RNA polymerase sigma-70 factor (ECF subfamily)
MLHTVEMRGYHQGRSMRDPVNAGVPPATSAPAETPAGEATIDLVERAKAGDEDARERLMAKCRRLLHRWARGRLPRYARDLADTEDLVQETLAKAMRNLPNFKWEREGALYCFLRQALRNRIIDEVRRVNRRPIQEQLDADAVGTDKSPYDQLVDREKHERYEAALARLRPIYREAIVGRIELQLSYEELATALSKTNANSARVTLMRAVQRLIEEMDREP